MGFGTPLDRGDMPNRCARNRFEMLEDIGVRDGHGGAQCRFRDYDFRPGNSTVGKSPRLKIIGAELGTLNRGIREKKHESTEQKRQKNQHYRD